MTQEKMHEGHKMPKDWQKLIVRHRANELIKMAKRLGITVTIELQAQQPLAMGNHQMVVEVRDRDYRS